MKILALILLAAACVLAPAQAAQAHERLLAPRGKCGAAERSFRKPSGAQQRALRCLVNHARRHAGRRAARRSAKLNRAAERKSNRIVRCRYFSHTPCRRPFVRTYRRTGYGRGSWAVGEVIAWGSRGAGDARSVMHGWLHSRGHRATILNRWRHAAVGRRHVRLLWGKRRVTVWTVSFGRP